MVVVCYYDIAADQHMIANGHQVSASDVAPVANRHMVADH
jgi:hypothetical protein